MQAKSPDAARVDEATLIWYLRDRGFDATEAEEKLVKMQRWGQTDPHPSPFSSHLSPLLHQCDSLGVSLHRWRRDFKPHLISRDSLSLELATKKAWVHTSVDKYGRPVVMIDAKKHVVGQFPLESSKR